MYFLNGGIFERWLGLNKAISVRPREPIGLWEEHGRKRPVPAPCPLSCDSLLQNCQQEGHQQMRPLDLGALPGAKTKHPCDSPGLRYYAVSKRKQTRRAHTHVSRALLCSFVLWFCHLWGGNDTLSFRTLLWRFRVSTKKLGCPEYWGEM